MVQNVHQLKEKLYKYRYRQDHTRVAQALYTKLGKLSKYTVILQKSSYTWLSNQKL